MRRSLVPSLAGMAAVESAARHGSITGAAAELCLSQSTVSRRVKQVEAAIQVRLFDRVRQRLVLTEAGRSYARDLRKIRSELEQATYQVMAYGAGTGPASLNLGVFSTFGTKWLVPRLEDFRRHHPGIVVSCYVRAQAFSFDDDPLDAAIHYGSPTWPGAISEALFGEDLVPVASPRLPGLRQLRTAHDALAFPLLHEVTRPWAWNRWFERNGVAAERALPGARFDQFSMISAAAKAGLGLAIVPRFLFEEDLARGDLVAPFRGTLPGEHQYYLVYPHRAQVHPALSTFRAWLRDAARRSAHA